MEIVKSGDVSKLLIGGKASEEECRIQWDEIVIKCSQDNGGLDYTVYIDLSQSLGILLSEYNIIRSWILKLWVIIDDEIIEKLMERGYNVITSKENPKYDESISRNENYKRSLVAAFTRSEHLVTKIKMKSNEMRLFIGDGTNRAEFSFDDVMAQLAVKGINSEDSITLSRYMSILKILSSRTKEEMV